MGHVRPGKDWLGRYGTSGYSDYAPLPDAQTNAFFARNNAEFIAACEGAGVKPTKSQASRWKAKRGAAYRWWKENKVAA